MTDEKKTDDYSNVTTIGGERSARSGDAADWSPRDALVEALRMVDSGEIEMSEIVVIYCEKKDGKVGVPGYLSASKCAVRRVGMVSTVFSRMASSM